MKKTIIKTVQNKRHYVAPKMDSFNLRLNHTLLTVSFDPTNEIGYGGEGLDGEFGD